MRQNACFHLHCTDPDQEDHGEVDNYIGHRIHQSGNTASKKLPVRQFQGIFFKGRNLTVLFAERAKHTHTGKILPGRGGNAVQRSLHPFVHRHRQQHQAKYNHAQNWDNTSENQRRLKVNSERHDHCAKDYER